MTAGYLGHDGRPYVVRGEGGRAKLNRFLFTRKLQNISPPTRDDELPKVKNDILDSQVRCY